MNNKITVLLCALCVLFGLKLGELIRHFSDKKAMTHIQVGHHYNQTTDFYIHPDSLVRIPCESSYIVVRNK